MTIEEWAFSLNCFHRLKGVYRLKQKSHRIFLWLFSSKISPTQTIYNMIFNPDFNYKEMVQDTIKVFPSIKIEELVSEVLHNNSLVREIEIKLISNGVCTTSVKNNWMTEGDVYAQLNRTYHIFIELLDSTMTIKKFIPKVKDYTKEKIKERMRTIKEVGAVLGSIQDSRYELLKWVVDLIEEEQQDVIKMQVRAYEDGYTQAIDEAGNWSDSNLSVRVAEYEESLNKGQI
jgi:hypothetical protein